jgi:hypothetical protein
MVSKGSMKLKLKSKEELKEMFKWERERYFDNLYNKVVLGKGVMLSKLTKKQIKLVLKHLDYVDSLF